MRVPISSVAIAALLCSLPFASVVQGHPVSDYTDIVEISKRGSPAPKPGSPAGKPGGPRTPSPKGSPKNPFDDYNEASPGSTHSDPFSDGKQGSPGSDTGGSGYKFRGFTDKEVKFADANKEGARLKGKELIVFLENPDSVKPAAKAPQSIKDEGYMYSDDSGKRMVPMLKLSNKGNPYKEYGLDVKEGEWILHDIKKPGSETIVKTYERPEKKAIIISMSDNKEQDPSGKMPWSAMVMSNWREASTASGTDVAELQYIIRNNIQIRKTTTSNGVELDTVAAMRDAFNAIPGAKTTETLTLDFKSQDKTMVQQVSVMSAQIHVARVLSMLLDYRNELKNLQISKLHLQHRENPVSDDVYNIMIELGR